MHENIPDSVELIEPCLLDNFSRTQLYMYGGYWLATGNSPRQYIRTLVDIECKFYDTIDRLLK